MSQRRSLASTNEPFLCITNPTGVATFYTGGTNLSLAGTAAALGKAITTVTWNNTANSRSGTASGANTWSITDVPLLSNRTNSIVVTATTTSWASGNGGNTTFNRTLSAIQSPIRALLSMGRTNATLTWTGGGAPYRVQRATNLVTGDWVDLMSNATAPIILPSPLLSGAAFYRLVGQ
jgi:hypothetical protein